MRAPRWPWRTQVAFKGFDKQLGIEIAWLKVTTNVHLSEEDKVRMQREVQILTSINTPHIIKVRAAAQAGAHAAAAVHAVRAGRTTAAAGGSRSPHVGPWS